MLENYDLIQKGFRKLLKSLAGYIGQAMSTEYGSGWWGEVRRALSDQADDLPYNGDYGTLVDSLDVLNCLHLIDRRWNEVFRDRMGRNCRTWAIELKGSRNIISHYGQQDVEQEVAERYLNTMELLCREVDEDNAAEIHKLYVEVRARSEENAAPTFVYTGAEQPAPASKRGALADESLLKLVGSEFVEKTTMTKKVTYGGKTEAYPVYRVRLDKLYYNDQNDRISTWLSQYESQNGVGMLSSLNCGAYNDIIEKFICESNPEAIQRTKNNIALVGQQQPGVVLADGRIVDGNRRYTCLRKIERETGAPQFFETVIMEMDIHDDKKQIKLLELALQHGEEKKVDYDLIDYAVGTYRDVVQTHLLTVDEYAQSANESLSEVNERIEVAKVICEFLEYLKLPEQYYVARDYQVYSLFHEMMAPLKKLNDLEKVQLKHIAFDNAMMNAIPDQRKFIRDIKKLIKNDTYTDYFTEQQKIEQKILELYGVEEIRSKQDVDAFAQNNQNIAAELQTSMERAMQKSRSALLKNKPAENVSKCIDLLMEVDTRLFPRMEQEDRDALQSNLSELSNIVAAFQKKLSE